MPIADQAYIRTCGNHYASQVQGTSTNFQYSHSQRMRMRPKALGCCHQLRLPSVSDLYIFQSRKYHRYRVQEESTEMPSLMHQDKRRLGEKYLVLRSYSGSAGYQNGFPDFSPQFWPAYQAGYHMTPRMCQTSSRIPFVLPSMPYHS